MSFHSRKIIGKSFIQNEDTEEVFIFWGVEMSMRLYPLKLTVLWENLRQNAPLLAFRLCLPFSDSKRN